MRQPISSLTNIALVIVGLILLSQSWFVGSSVIALGIASGVYHWTKTRLWQYIDVWCIFLVFYGISEHLLLGTWYFTPFATVITSYLHYHGVFRSWYMIGVVGTFAGISFLIMNPLLDFIGIVCIFAIGMGIHLLTDGDSHRLHDLGHSAWHVTSALGILLLMI